MERTVGLLLQAHRQQAERHARELNELQMLERNTIRRQQEELREQHRQQQVALNALTRTARQEARGGVIERADPLAAEAGAPSALKRVETFYIGDEAEYAEPLSDKMGHTIEESCACIDEAAAEDQEDEPSEAPPEPPASEAHESHEQEASIETEISRVDAHDDAAPFNPYVHSDAAQATTATPEEEASADAAFYNPYVHRDAAMAALDSPRSSRAQQTEIDAATAADTSEHDSPSEHESEPSLATEGTAAAGSSRDDDDDMHMRESEQVEQFVVEAPDEGFQHARPRRRTRTEAAAFTADEFQRAVEDHPLTNHQIKMLRSYRDSKQASLRNETDTATIEAIEGTIGVFNRLINLELLARKERRARAQRRQT